MRRGHVLVPFLLALCAAGCHKGKPQTGVEPSQPGAPPPPPAPSPTPPPPPPATGDAAAATTRALTAELGTMIHFDYDQDVIKPEDRPVLDSKAAILKANPAVRLRISGHADERGSDEYNLVLGNKRALAAKRYLESKGVDASRIEITSFGEERPIDSASTEEAWAKNRRDEFEIIAGGDRLVRPQ
jgi:peptidoglycan-associated lipoprotein